MVGALVAAAALVAAGEQTLTFTAAQISVPAYGVKQGVMLAPSPQIDGYIVGMKAEVVDAQGNVQGDDDVMLHHVVLAKIGTPDATCPQLPAERFYAEGEERQRLELPAPYGYPNRGTDRWGLVYMLMNHHGTELTGAVRYHVRYVTGEPRTPVRPYWLDQRNCGNSEFDVRGTGGKGSRHVESWDYVMPESGRAVAGGGHLHGGGVSLDLLDRTCNRTLFSSQPTWGGPEPKPLLHEPGPAKMSQFSTAAGIPLAAGTRLRLAAVYDNSRPHTRAMGIMMLYLAPGSVSACDAVPQLDVDLGAPTAPPPFAMPFPRAPRGPLAKNLRQTWVGDNRFGHERVSLARNTRLLWRFVGQSPHDVTVIGGPEGFSSPPSRPGGATFTWRFTRKGTYRIICSLHPTQMVQRVDVR
jgi:hypothetical protein